jgi:hypothetical protein
LVNASLTAGLFPVNALMIPRNYLPYSNEIFGGPQNTYRVLDDSNVGWGGGLKALAAYVKEHRITNCWIAYSPFPDPTTFGIPCRPLPSFFGFMAAMMGGGGPPQSAPESIDDPVFISSEEIGGSGWGAEDMSPYLQFVPLHPAHVIADEILEYDGTFSIPRIASVAQSEAALTILQRKGSHADALAHARDAVRLDPDCLPARALTGVLAANGLKEEARREYQVAKHIVDTVHPEFQRDEWPPTDPDERP